MSDENRKELEQLLELLILDEEWFQQELDSAKRMIGQNPQQPAPAPRNTAPVKTAPVKTAPPKAAPVRNYGSVGQTEPRPRKPVPEDAPMPKQKGIKGLLILALLEALGILGLAAYWALVLLR